MWAKLDSYVFIALKDYGLWCLTPLSTIFQLYRGGLFSRSRRGGQHYLIKFVSDLRRGFFPGIPVSSTKKYLFVCLMVFNAIFNNIQVTSWESVLLMEETG
jgi:hypothetical protein